MKVKLKALKNRLLHNLGLKLISVLLAFIIWFIVAQVGDPKDTRPYYNIPVHLVNTSLFEEQNKFYEVINNTDTVRVNVTAPTSVFQTLRANDIVAEADVAKLTDINTIAITCYTQNKYSEISFEFDHDVVMLNVEPLVTKKVAVNPQTSGEVAEGYWIESKVSDQTQVTISGPQSVVDEVQEAYAEMDVSGETGECSASVALRLKDKSGQFLDMDKITMSVDHVQLKAKILPTKEIPIIAKPSGKPRDGYRVVDTEIDVDKVLVAGTATVLNNTGKLEIPASEIDITDKQTDEKFTINVKGYLGDLKIADKGFNGFIHITVKIKPERERTMEIPLNKISFTNVPEGFEIKPSDGEEANTVTIKIFGLSDEVNEVRPASLFGIVDVTEWMKNNGITELSPGHRELPVQVNLGENIEIRDIGTVSAEISRKE